MTAVRPTGFPTWCATGATNLAQPDGTHQNLGWGVGEAPPSSYFNFLQQQYDKWIRYGDAVTTDLFSPVPPTPTSDSAQLTLRGPSGASGSARFQVDHLGNPFSPNIFAMHEDWSQLAVVGATLYSGIVPNAPRWTVASTGSAQAASVILPQSGYPAPAFNIANGASLGAWIQLISTVALVTTGTSGTVAALVGDVGPHGAIPGTNTMVFGVGNFGINGFSGAVFTGGSGIGASGFAWFRRQAGTTAWLCEVATGQTAITSVNSGVSPRDLGLGPQSLRMELCAPGSPYGAQTRFLIDGTLVATGPAFQRQGCILAALRQDASGFGDSLEVGSIDFVVNKKP